MLIGQPFSIDSIGSFQKRIVIALERLVLLGVTPVRKLSENSSRRAATMDSDLVKFFVCKTLEAIKPLKVRIGRSAESDTDW